MRWSPTNRLSGSTRRKLRAQHVVIVGELQDISQAVEASLVAAGSRVERVQGTAAQIAAGLERILNPGGPV